MFITFEGIEGSGKTSQAEVTAAALGSYGPGLLTREPGGTAAGEQLREILLSPGGAGLTPMAELLLLSTARAQLVGEVLLPALGRGENVICVRYTDSSRAYQGGGAGLPLAEVESAIALATGGLEPDLTLYLDVDPVEGLRRRERARDVGVVGPQEGWNHFDARALEFHTRVRAAYLRVARDHPARVVSIDASQPFDVVSQEILRAVLPRLTSQRPAPYG